MPALHEVQAAFAAAVLTGKPGPLPFHVAPMTLGAERRIQIYRNHFTISLTECLSATFPVLKALVGETYFDQCARSFAGEFPPSSPVLFEYGESFPAFLADATGSSDFAYFADLGAFEWAINHAYHADDVEPFDARTLLATPGERRGDLMFRLHPSSKLVVSIFPILDIWRANQPGCDSTQTIDLAAGGVRLLVWRNGIDVVWRELNGAEAAFIASLIGGSMLTMACADALAADASFQPATLLAELIDGALLTGFSLPAQPTER